MTAGTIYLLIVLLLILPFAYWALGMNHDETDI
jgi:cbb3-type cytochrome oxidase subunit 3